jgi:hypothetical protein
MDRSTDSKIEQRNEITSAVVTAAIRIYMKPPYDFQTYGMVAIDPEKPDCCFEKIEFS